MIPIRKKLAPHSRRAIRSVPAVTRAIAILRHLADSPEPLGVVALARAVKVVPSTCLHILRVLASEGLIFVNLPTRKYSLGTEVLLLAQAYFRRNPFVQVAGRRLNELARAHGCAFAAIEQQGTTDCVVVAIGESMSGRSLRVSVGTRFPTLVSAHGLCMVAFGAIPGGQLRDRFSELHWDCPPTFSQWLHEIERSRLAGYAIDNGHYIRGVRIIAFPVFSSRNDLMGSIAAVGLSEQFDADSMAMLTSTFREIAMEITSEMAAYAAMTLDE